MKNFIKQALVIAAAFVVADVVKDARPVRRIKQAVA